MLATRPFAATGRNVTAVGFGAWAIGGTWGEVTEQDAVAALHAALDAGVDFIDTADVYGDGRSERIIASVLATRTGPCPCVATKVGRRITPHTPENYTRATLEAHIDRSRRNLRMDCLDLVQLHCPPSAVFDTSRVFEAMQEIRDTGKIANFGVSVERIEEAEKAIAYPGVISVQIIYNLFRQRPSETFFAAAARENIAIIARVPLASGLLTGKMTAASTFADDDHRSFNRDGAAFDKGETFSGVPYDVALEAVEALRPIVPHGTSMSAFALRWILMQDAVTVVIPGAKSPAQAIGNAAALTLPPIPPQTMQAARDIYTTLIAPHVHSQW